MSTDEDTPLSAPIVASDPDGNPITFALLTAPTHGTLTLTPGGTADYAPAGNYHGTDSFAIRVTDNASGQADATVTITINAVNDVPTAQAETFRVSVGAALPLLANDADPDADPLTLDIVTQPRGGTVAMNGAGEVIFTRERDFTGPIEFTYRVSDGRSTSNTVTARGVIGDFQPFTFLGDETTPGKYEIHLFDGLATRRLNAALPPDGQIDWYTQSYDALHILYVVERTSTDEIYVVPVDGSSAPRLLYTATKPAGADGFLTGWVNREFTHMFINDVWLPAGKQHLLLNLATLAHEVIGIDSADVAEVRYPTFGGDAAIYMQGRVDSGPGTYWNSVFRAPLSAPRSVTRVGLDYSGAGHGSGSGLGLWPGGADDRYIYHGEMLINAEFHINTLVYDTATGTDAPLYPRAVGTERGSYYHHMAEDRSRMCFSFANSGFGIDAPAYFYVGYAGIPGSFVPMTTQVTNPGTCQFLGDNRSILYSQKTGAGPEFWNEVYFIDAAAPFVARKLSHDERAGETSGRVSAATKAMRVTLGYRDNATQLERLYDISVNDGLGETLYLDDFDGSVFYYDEMNPQGTWLANSQLVGGRQMLRLSSTQTLNYSLPMLRSDATLGVKSVRWLRAFP